MLEADKTIWAKSDNVSFKRSNALAYLNYAKGDGCFLEKLTHPMSSAFDTSL